MYTDDANYVSGRLSGTLVRYGEDATPVIVTAVGNERGSIVLQYTSLEGIRLGVDKINKFNLASPPLGYTNVDGSSFYLARQPKRHDWRQGIRRENLCILREGQECNYSFSSLSPVAIPLKGKYPSYSEAVDRVEDLYSSCAFSKNFALDDRGRLWYKGMNVVGADNNSQPQLGQRYSYLEEALIEDLSDV